MAVPAHPDRTTFRGVIPAAWQERIVRHGSLLYGRRRVVLWIWGACLLLGLLHAFLWPKTYLSKASLMTIEAPDPLGIAGAEMGVGGGKADQLAALGLAAGQKESKLINILQSRTLAEHVIERSGLLPFLYKRDWDFEKNTWKDPEDAPPMEWVVRRFSKKIFQARYDKQNRIITIEVKIGDPVLAQRIGQLALEDLQRTLNDKSFSVAGQNRRFIEKRLGEVHEELRRAEQAVKDFKEKHELYDLDRQIAGSLDMVTNLESQLLARDIELGMLRNFTTEANPKVRLIQREIDLIRSQIASIRTGEGKSVADLALFPALQNTPEIALEFIRLQRHYMVQEKLYDLLVTHFELAKIAEVRDDLAFQVIDEPSLPVRHHRPRKLISLAAAFFLGGLVAIGWAYAVEYREAVRETADRVRRAAEGGGPEPPEHG